MVKLVKLVLPLVDVAKQAAVMLLVAVRLVCGASIYIEPGTPIRLGLIRASDPEDSEGRCVNSTVKTGQHAQI
jgi:hypothetical protein